MVWIGRNQDNHHHQGCPMTSWDSKLAAVSLGAAGDLCVGRGRLQKFVEVGEHDDDAGHESIGLESATGSCGCDLRASSRECRDRDDGGNEGHLQPADVRRRAAPDGRQDHRRRGDGGRPNR